MSLENVAKLLKFSLGNSPSTTARHQFQIKKKKLEGNIETMAQQLKTFSETYQILSEAYKESLDSNTNHDFIKEFNEKSESWKTKIDNLNAELDQLKSAYKEYEKPTGFKPS